MVLFNLNLNLNGENDVEGVAGPNGLTGFVGMACQGVVDRGDGDPLKNQTTRQSYKIYLVLKNNT